MAVIPQDIVEEMRQAVAGGEPVRAMARRFPQYPYTTIRRALGQTQATDEVHEFRRVAHPDGEKREVITDRPIKTMAEAIAVANVDESVYYVHRWGVTNWTTAMKIRDGDTDKPILVQQYRVWLDLRLIMPRPQYAALDAIYKRMAKYAPRYPKLPPLRATKAEAHLAVFGLFDVHFGKLAWAQETNENYDLRIADTIYRNAVADMVARSKHLKIGLFLLPIGNDLFHIDNSRNMTYAGTPQDVDGRYAKIIETAEIAVIKAVEAMVTIAPVHVSWVPGNHDPTTSYHLARTIAAWFRHCRRVCVDYGASPRKYLRYGKTLIGMTHGNEENHAALANIMAMERPKEWAETTCREWLIGHWHSRKAYMTRPVESRDGTTIRVLPSLASTDAWHHRKGFISTTHSAEVYWYGARQGYSGHGVVNARY